MNTLYVATWRVEQYGRGYWIVDAGDFTRKMEYSQLRLETDGLECFGVVGESDRPHLRDFECFAPGARVQLRDEPERIGVVCHHGRHRIGHIHPMDVARIRSIMSLTTAYFIWEQFREGSRSDVRIVLINEGQELPGLQSTEMPF